MRQNKSAPRADFSFVRYANCWEDPELLVAGLQPTKNKRILSIASAGDNAFRLLAEGAEVVVADLNMTQLACVELRRSAMKRLSHGEFLSFCGILPQKNRLHTYILLRNDLSGASQKFWDSQQDTIENGFIHGGKFERYFATFRKRVLPLIHSSATVQQLLQPKTQREQKIFYETHWDNRRWQMLFRLFFNRKVMGILGRDPSFFDYVEGKVADQILERTRYALTTLDTSRNPYLRYILTGNFGTTFPPYLEKDNYIRAQKNIDNLIIAHGSINSVASTFGPDSFDGFNLSDIFEYLSPKQCEAVYGELLDTARAKARFAYWNMLAPRDCPARYLNRVTPLFKKSKDLFLQDRAFFYSRFVLEEVL